MFNRVLKRMQEKVRGLDYLMSTHAEEEMEDDDLTIFDVEEVILTGEVIERQRDYTTNEWKYLIRGQINGDQAIVVTKLSLTGRLIIITVYLE